MNTNVEALQRLYVKMGGNPEDVSDKTTISEMIDAITTIGIVDKVARSGNYITATTAAEMDNEDAIYVYTGSETGYNQGHLYYWDGTAFVDGGEYNGARAEIDPTLSHTGKAADAKKTGDALASLNGSLDTLSDKELIGATVINYSQTQTGNGLSSFYNAPMTAGSTYLISVDVDYTSRGYANDNFFILSQYNGTQTAVAEIVAKVTHAFMLYTPVANSNMVRIFAKGKEGTAYTATVKIKNVTALSALTGGKYCSEGDSITAHNNWSVSRVTVSSGYTGFNGASSIAGYQSYIVSKYSMTLTNNGESGNSIVESLSAMLARDYSTYDLISIAYGVNDARKNVPLGEIGGGTETEHSSTTFYGAYRKVLDKIFTDNPKANVVLMAPLQRHTITDFGVDTPNANGAYLKDFRDAVKNLADMYSCKFWDGYGKSGYNQKNIYQLSYDGVHPNNEGYKVIAQSLLNVIAEFG